MGSVLGSVNPGFVYLSISTLSRTRHDWQHLTDETWLDKATILEKYEKVKHTMAAEALNVIVRCFIGSTREIIITAAGKRIKIANNK